MKIRGIHAEAFGGQNGGKKNPDGKKRLYRYSNTWKRNEKDVITSSVESISGIKHTAIFPSWIIEELIKLLCPIGGIVLDPYIGSGTTAIAAIKEGRHYIGMDIDPLYCNLSMKRIKE